MSLIYSISRPYMVAFNTWPATLRVRCLTTKGNTRLHTLNADVARLQMQEVGGGPSVGIHTTKQTVLERNH